MVEPGGAESNYQSFWVRLGESWKRFIATRHAVRRLLAIGVGTAGFSMQDVLDIIQGRQDLARWAA